jgi:hypothetical protein
MKTGHIEHIKEATEIELHPNNMNREEGFSLNKAWKPPLQTLEEHWKAPLSKEK